MMLSTQLLRAQLSSALCAANMVTTVAFCRLATEIAVHDRLKVSHAALQKQAGGLSAEYKRATEAIGRVEGSGARGLGGVATGDGKVPVSDLENMTASLKVCLARSGPCFHGVNLGVLEGAVVAALAAAHSLPLQQGRFNTGAPKQNLCIGVTDPPI
jgi:hypothetical protein